MLLNIGAILTRCLFGFRQLLVYQFKPVHNENAQHPRFTDVPPSFLLAAISLSSVFTFCYFELAYKRKAHIKLQSACKPIQLTPGIHAVFKEGQ